MMRFFSSSSSFNFSLPPALLLAESQFFKNEILYSMPLVILLARRLGANKNPTRFSKHASILIENDKLKQRGCLSA